MQSIPCNLDAMSRPELQAFAVTNAQEADGVLATLLDPVQAPVRRQLVNYAYTKIAAIDYRLAGRIALAMEYEDTCERIYNRLPECVQW